MAGALMMNGETFDKYFCPGQPRCVNQLKNPHDLSLWITAFFAQRMDAPTGKHRPQSTSASILVYWRSHSREAPSSPRKQRQFRREVTVARTSYTQGPALLRQLQDSIGYGMRASAHFSGD